MPRLPWFPFYAADWLLDEAVIDMSLAARGAFITLLAFEWRDGSIPSEIELLARRCQTDSQGMAGLWQELRHCFIPHPEKSGRLVNTRLERERERQEERSEKLATAGKRGAKARRKKGKSSQGEAIARPIARPMARPMARPIATECQSESESESESESKTEEKIQGEKRAPARARASIATDDEFLDRLQQNSAYRDLDVRREFTKMQAWCEVNRKPPTRRRFLNWLNRADKPMNAGGNRADRRPAIVQSNDPDKWDRYHQNWREKMSGGADANDDTASQIGHAS